MLPARVRGIYLGTVLGGTYFNSETLLFHQDLARSIKCVDVFSTSFGLLQ